MNQIVPSKDMQDNLTFEPCPNCGRPMPVNDGYTTWCSNCDWGLLAEAQSPSTSQFDRIYDKLSLSQGDRLLNEVMAKDRGRSRLSVSLALAYGIAGSVYVVSLLILVAAAYLGVALVRIWQRGVPFFASIPALAIIFMLVGIAWVTRPRFGKIPKEHLARNETPVLHNLIDELVSRLHTKPVRVVVLLPQYNAYFAKLGWRREPVLGVGLPALVASSAQEIVALLGHELAHGVNHDPDRSLIIEVAIDTLRAWHDLIYPDIYGSPSIIQLAMAGLAQGPRLLGNALAYLTFPNMQRAEYFADDLGARLAGGSAMVTLLRKLELTGAYQTIAQRAWARRKTQAPDVYGELRAYAANLPAREMERFERVQAKTRSRIDATHPPTAFRVKALEALQDAFPSVALDEARYSALVRELKQLEPAMQSRLFGED